MIRYRKASRVRDIVGACFLAVAALLLWVEHTTAPEHTGWVQISPDVEVMVFPEPTPVLRAPTVEAHG